MTHLRILALLRTLARLRALDRFDLRRSSEEGDRSDGGNSPADPNQWGDAGGERDIAFLFCPNKDDQVSHRKRDFDGELANPVD